MNKLDHEADSTEGGLFLFIVANVAQRQTPRTNEIAEEWRDLSATVQAKPSQSYSCKKQI